MTQLSDDLASLRIPDTPPPSHRGRWMVVAVIALLALIVMGWKFRTAAAVVPVEVVHPSVEQANARTAGTELLTASGYVVARRKAVVSAKIQGRLSDLRVEEGSRVREGDVLARLDSADYEAQVARAEANARQASAQVTSAEAQIHRVEAELTESRRVVGVNERLAREQVLPTDMLDASRSRVRVGEATLAQVQADLGRATAGEQQARAEMAYARALLANTVIRAPFTGTVVKKMAEIGESVAPIPPGVNLSTSSGAIVALADLDTLEVEVDVAEANVARLGADQPAEVTVEAVPDRRYKAVLRQVIPTADRTRATVLVKVTILDKDPNLKPEMSARATFLERGGTSDAAGRPQVLAPRTALVTRDGRQVAFEIANGVARLRPVKSGGARQDQVVILEGLSGAEVLVNTPPDTLKDGDAVRVK